LSYQVSIFLILTNGLLYLADGLRDPEFGLRMLSAEQITGRKRSKLLIPEPKRATDGRLSWAEAGENPTFRSQAGSFARWAYGYRAALRASN
jgi:hypothetical protein